MNRCQYLVTVKNHATLEIGKRFFIIETLRAWIGSKLTQDENYWPGGLCNGETLANGSWILTFSWCRRS